MKSQSSEVGSKSENYEANPTALTGSNNRMGNKPDGAARQAFASVFKLGRSQREGMLKTIGREIDKIMSQVNEIGQPVRWCYVPTLPQFEASGKCLALDFGCSDHYFKVSLCSVQLDEDTTFEPVDCQIFLVPPTIRRAGMEQFCDFVAGSVKQVMLENNVKNTKDAPIYMGVAAGFDVRVKAQKSPASATVLFSSKDYRMRGFIGSDFVPLFHAAFEKSNINVRIVAVMNDTVGLLLAGVHKARLLSDSKVNCSIGVLCHRAGSNMSFLETNAYFLYQGSQNKQYFLLRQDGKGNCVVVNAEAGYWIGADGALNNYLNFIEEEVMKQLKIENARLEHIISGAWYPYNLMQSIRHLASQHLLGLTIDTSWQLDNTECYEIFSCCDRWRSRQGATSAELVEFLKPKLSVHHLRPSDAVLIATICEAIVGRTAEVLSIGIMSIAKRVYGPKFPEKMAIAYTGSLFMTVPQLKQLLEASLKAQIPSGTAILLVDADVAFGCAVTALSAGLVNARDNKTPSA